MARRTTNIPEIHQIEKLRCLGILWYKFKVRFWWIWICSEEFEFLGLVDFGGEACSVESYINGLERKYRVAKMCEMPYLYRSFFAKTALWLVAVLQKETWNLRHPMHLCHPVSYTQPPYLAQTLNPNPKALCVRVCVCVCVCMCVCVCVCVYRGHGVRR